MSLPSLLIEALEVDMLEARGPVVEVELSVVLTRLDPRYKMRGAVSLLEVACNIRAPLDALRMSS